MTGTAADEFRPITITEENEVHRDFRRVVKYAYREDGNDTEVAREIMVARPSVAIVAFDPKLDKLVMIRQFRLGAHLGTGKGMTVEVVAGIIDDGEEPQISALRELKEESGLDAQNLTKLCQFLTTPGMTNEVVHLYYAEVDASNLTDRAGLETESEETFPFLLSLSDALKAVDENGINNGIVMIALLWFERHRKNLLQGNV